MGDPAQQAGCEGVKERGYFLADGALAASIRIAMEMRACEPLKKVCMHPELQARLPGYAGKMGYGLHHGWAIEGAIGSSKKIDVSYLSPHAKLADRLEACTKGYKALFLFGDWF